MIKNLGGVFGRNPTFNNVEVEGDLTVDGNYVVAGKLDYLNIKDNFSISQTQPNFSTYSLMAAADTAFLQAVNNQRIT